MDLTIIVEYLSPLIVLACLVVGFLIKHCIPNEQINHFIPLIVAILGMILNVWVVGVFDLATLVAGAISGLASTGLYEAFAQILKSMSTTSPVLPEQPE